MNAQRFQQVRTDIRRTMGCHALALGLGLLLLAALAADHLSRARAILRLVLCDSSWPGGAGLDSA